MSWCSRCAAEIARARGDNLIMAAQWSALHCDACCELRKPEPAPPALRWTKPVDDAAEIPGFLTACEAVRQAIAVHGYADLTANGVRIARLYADGRCEYDPAPLAIPAPGEGEHITVSHDHVADGFCETCDFLGIPQAGEEQSDEQE